MRKPLAVIMNEHQLEQSVIDGLWTLTCPYCGADVDAEPDAQQVCCQDCDKHIVIVNPYF